MQQNRITNMGIFSFCIFLISSMFISNSYANHSILDSTLDYPDNHGSWILLFNGVDKASTLRISEEGKTMKAFTENLWDCYFLNGSDECVYNSSHMIFEVELKKNGVYVGKIFSDPSSCLELKNCSFPLELKVYPNVGMTGDFISNNNEDEMILFRANTELTSDFNNVEQSTVPSKEIFVDIANKKIGILNSNFSGFDDNNWRELNAKITSRYAQLYNHHSDLFKWAGLAAFASNGVGWIEWREDWSSLDLLGPSDELALWGKGNLAVYQDLVWQHEAYLWGGIATLEKIHNEGDLNKEILSYWQIIDEGRRNQNSDLVWEGNKLLLEFEQRETLQKKCMT